MGKTPGADASKLLKAVLRDAKSHPDAYADDASEVTDHHRGVRLADGSIGVRIEELGWLASLAGVHRWLDALGSLQDAGDLDVDDDGWDRTIAGIRFYVFRAKQS